MRHDFGLWSVFELTAPARREAVALARKPILVLTSFSAKLTRKSDYNFLRLAEEEFMNASGPTLAFRPEYSADALPDAGMFSGLVVESYRCGDTGAAFREIQRFLRQEPVVLIESDAPLFGLLRDRLAELGQVSIVGRAKAGSDRWIGLGRPVSYRFDPVRMTWANARHVTKFAAKPRRGATDCEVTGAQRGANSMLCGGWKHAAGSGQSQYEFSPELAA